MALEQRTRERFPLNPEASHADYVSKWKADGKTLHDLAQDLNLGLGADFISRHLARIPPRQCERCRLWDADQRAGPLHGRAPAGARVSLEAAEVTGSRDAVGDP